MVPRKLSVLFSFFSYGGNGGIASEHPDVRRWYSATLQAAVRDERISEVSEFEISDTPITLGRNKAVLVGRNRKADVLVMVDSDQSPDLHLGEPGSKPFFQSSFDFIYDNWDKGPHVVGAPYCGPPPNELVYVFRWERPSSLDTVDCGTKIGMYSRTEAAIMSGIQPSSGLPTGLIMYDMRIFDVCEPKDLEPGEVAKGWFYYEWEDKYAANKISTEDGTATRDMALIGCAKLGYNPVHCNWDAWAGHWKPYCVPKPRPVTVEAMTERFRAAAIEGRSDRHRMTLVGSGEGTHGELGKFFAGEIVNEVAPSELKESDLYDGNATVEDWKVLSGLVKKHANGQVVVEVGSFVGQTAKLLSRSGAGVVWCVDTWEGSYNDSTGEICKHVDIKSKFDENCKDEIEANRIVGWKIDSISASAFMKDKSAALVYIDANHGYDEVLADIKAWLPKVKSGGVVAGHDFDIRFGDGRVAFPGVRKAVEEVFGDDFVRPVPGSSVWYHVVK